MSSLLWNRPLILRCVIEFNSAIVLSEMQSVEQCWILHLDFDLEIETKTT